MNINDPLVKEFITELFGKKACKVIGALNRGKEDVEIAKETKIDVSEIRSILNQLHYHGIVTYTKEKTAPYWYTYTWYLREERLKELIKEKMKEDLEELERQLEYEKNYTFFKCPNGCEKLPFEIAFEYDFRCPECNQIMEQIDNSKDIKALERKIRRIKNKLERW